MTKILIVEDSLDLLYFLEIFLNINKFETKAISSTNEVDGALNNFKPDVILLDVWLRDDDGRDICRKIKENNPSILIILMSANAELLKNYQECNADDVIEKPFDNVTILSKINKVLQPA